MSFEQISFLFILVLLVFSAFFSGSESALFSISKSELYNLALSNKNKDNLIAALMKQPQKILISILIGNLVVNILLTTFTTNLLLEKFGDYGQFIAIAVVTPLIIIICEIIPKTMSINASIPIARKFIQGLFFFHILFFPVRIIFIAVSNFLIRLFGIQISSEHNLSQKEIDIAVRVNESNGYLDKHEGAFIKNVLRFSQKTAENVMIPRNEATSISYDAEMEEAISLFRDSGHLRIPVYKGDMDKIIGLIDSRDFIPYHFGVKSAKNFKRLIKDISHFPESKELADLLNEFLLHKLQMAVLVDEYGGTSGVVTLSAIISEVMGDNFRLDDLDQKPDVRKIKDLTVVSGDMQIDDFNDTFDDTIYSNESETVGGYVIEKTGNIPSKGDYIETSRYKIKVRNIRKNKIESLEIFKI